MPSFLHLLLTLMLVALPTGGRFGSVQLDEDHEAEHTKETTTKQVAGEHRQHRPLREPRVSDPQPPRPVHPGFVVTSNPRAVELALRGAAERRML